MSLRRPADKSNISHKYLQNKIVIPRFIKAYKKLESEKRRTDGIICYQWARLDHHFEILKVILEL